MNYEEFSDIQELNNQYTKFIKGFSFPNGESFYIEPTFYTQLMTLQQIYPNDFPCVIEQMKKMVLERKHIIFVMDYEHPFIEIPGFKYLEIDDVTNPIHVYYEDKSRGSDYGD